MIVAKDGRTPYVFDNDVLGSGKSACVGPCEGLHPPYLATPGETAQDPWSFVVRADGSKQWAYRVGHANFVSRRRKRDSIGRPPDVQPAKPARESGNGGRQPS